MTSVAIAGLKALGGGLATWPSLVVLHGGGMADVNMCGVGSRHDIAVVTECPYDLVISFLQSPDVSENQSVHLKRSVERVGPCRKQITAPRCFVMLSASSL